MSTILNVWCDICVHLQAWAILGGGLIVWYAFHTERRDMREARHQTPTPHHVARPRKVVLSDDFRGAAKVIEGVHQTDTLSTGTSNKGMHNSQHHVGGSNEKVAALVRVEPVKGVTTTDTLGDTGRWAA